MNNNAVSIFNRYYYTVGEHIYLKENGSCVEKIITDVEITYHKNIHYEKVSVLYHICDIDGYNLEGIREEELNMKLYRSKE